MANKKQNGEITKKPNMKLFMEAAKAKMEMEASQVAGKTVVAIDAVTPELKALGRNIGYHIGVKVLKAGAEMIVGQNDLLDSLESGVQKALLLNDAWNVGLAVHKGKKAYQEADDEALARVEEKARKLKDRIGLLKANGEIE